MKYAFLLGKNPELSLAELGCFFGTDVMRDKTSTAAMTEKDLPAHPQKFLNTLGGCTAVLKIIKEDLSFADVENEIEEYLKKVCEEKAGKCNFAITLLPERKKSQALKFLLTNIKKKLKMAGVRANFMNKDFKNVNEVFAVKQGLVSKGTWICILESGEGKVTLGYYVAAQDFEKYSKRDYGKPFRDPEAGMLPPKLAQAMINLTSTLHPPPSTLIYDPFCGTGTILMESLLMGYSVIGSDNSKKMTDGAQKNLEWLRQNFRIPENLNWKIFTKSADAVDKDDLAAEDIAVATEPYLGQPLSNFPSENFLRKAVDELSNLYLEFFRKMLFLRSNSTITIIFPYWRNPATKEKFLLSAQIIDKIKALGYIKTVFVPLNTDSLFYERPDQIVGREIVRLVRN